jgi:hypothetical protein
MKTTIVSVVLIAMIACVCLAQSQPAASKHEPNSGFVSDDVVAKDIAKVVLSRLLTPDDFKRKEFSDAVLKDGVWTVRYWEPKTRINFPVVIQIRQQSGSIIKYEDPNA